MSIDDLAGDRGDEFEPTGTEAEDVQGSAAEEDAAAAAADTAAAEDSEAVGTERDEKGRFIPKDRFDEAVKRERDEKERLASRLAELERREADRAVATDLQEASAALKEMIKEHTTLLADGELDKAAELMGSILQLQGDMADRRAQAHADQGRSQAKNEIQYDAVVARLEAEYPEINPEDTENFDRAAVRRVQAYMTGLINMEKMTPAQALQEAVTTLLGGSRAAGDANARNAAELGVRRKTAAVTAALDAKKRQPANTRDVGQDHDKTGGALDANAVMKLSWEEFIKLPEEKLSALRGDTVE